MMSVSANGEPAMTTRPRTNNSQTSPIAKTEARLNARMKDYIQNPPRTARGFVQDHGDRKKPGSMKN